MLRRGDGQRDEALMIDPVIVDGAFNWPLLFAEKSQETVAFAEEDKVVVVFGCWTSVSRKSVLPVFEKDNGLLFYPVQYEGEELSKNIFYTAEAVNQQAIPAVDYLLAQGKKKFYLIGTDYVYPQTTDLILYNCTCICCMHIKQGREHRRRPPQG